MDDPNRHIWQKFHIHKGDTLPFVGFKDYTRDELAILFNELGYKTGAEIGVKRGWFSNLLCESIPDLKLLCVDPWTKYSRSVGDERAEQHYKVAAKVLSPYNATLMRMTSMEAVKEIPNDSLDFVYIDGLHDFDSVILDLIHWTPKVRIGGIVSGHDYIHHFEGGVIQAVNAYTYAHNIHSWYITKGEPLPSFYWVR